MIAIRRALCTLSIYLIFISLAHSQDPAAVKEVALDAPNGVKIRVRMEGPYTAETPLQIVCYFPYSTEAVSRMQGAPVELDKHLGGIIASLRQRGEFAGTTLETLVITPTNESIPAKQLMLIGLGNESELTTDVLTRIGQTAFQTAAALGTQRVAFAPLIRDQGNSTIPTGDVEVAVLKGMLLANDTQTRLQSQGLAKEFVLQEWIVEAGPTFFDETVAGVKKAIQEAEAVSSQRPATPYQTIK